MSATVPRSTRHPSPTPAEITKKSKLKLLADFGIGDINYSHALQKDGSRIACALDCYFVPRRFKLLHILRRWVGSCPAPQNSLRCIKKVARFRCSQKLSVRFGLFFACGSELAVRAISAGFLTHFWAIFHVETGHFLRILS